MIRARLACWLAALSFAAEWAPSQAAPPRSLDSRLVFEKIAAEPDIVTPTGIAVDGHGRVLVIESHTHFRPAGYQGPPADRIRVFEDRDHDGKPECTGSFFDGTEKTMNLAVAPDGSVWVATRSAIYRLEDRDGDGRADGQTAGKLPAPLIRLETKGDYPHNGLSGFAFDHAGSVHFGLGENLGADYRLIGPDGTTFSGGGEGGSIYRCRPDGTKLERIATGFWNPFHMAFDIFGRLFAVDNDPDSRPPCRLLHIVDGGDYGYRFRNGRRGTHPFTAWNGELPGTLGMVAGTGEAPSGVIAYEGNNLPDDYRGALLVTSWGDHRIEQFRLEPIGASFRSVMKPVVVGADDFRPVGIAAAPDGTLYISDWVDKSYDVHGKGRIWRLRANQPDRGRAREAGREIDGTARFEARALSANVLPNGQIDLKAIVSSDVSPVVRAEAMRRLSDPSAKQLLLKALESDDPFIQEAARQGLKRSMKVDELITLAATKGLTAPQRLGLLLIVRDSGKPAGRALVPRFLSDPDPLIHFAAIQWVGEQRLEEFRPQLLADLVSTASTRNLFEATLASLERLDEKARGPKEEVAGEEYIAALVKDPKTSTIVLERALRMLRPDHPALTLDRLSRLATGRDAAVAIEATRALCQIPPPARFEVLTQLATNRNLPASLHAEAIVGLADDATNRRGALLAIAAGNEPVVRREALRSLRGVALSEQEISALRAASAGDDASLELLDRLTGTTADRGKPGGTDLDGWLARLEGPADPAAGERVFFHPKGPGCYRCHQVNGRGGRAGPDLSALSAGMDRQRLVESILTPSKEIAPQFVAWSVAGTDGTVFSGVLLEQTPEGSLVFADTQGRTIAIRSDLIAERKPQTTSIMPDNLAQIMSLQEFRDVLAFLSMRK